MTNIRDIVNADTTSWPEGKRFALCLTHDVDRVDKYWWQCAYYFVKNKDPYQFRSLFTKNRDRPFWNFEKIMEIERDQGVRSTFFFLNETKRLNILKPSTFKLSIGYYDINDPRIIDIMKTLDSGGWEIGVHGSYDSYMRGDLLVKEKAELERLLGKQIPGIRQHYLNLDSETTWKLQKEAGFKYDSSFGLRCEIGNRDGKSLPFHPIDDGFLEIPLTIMDHTLFSISRDKEQAWQMCLELIDRAEKNNSLLTILWHNNKFNDNECPGQAEIYERIIEECLSRNAWVTTAGGVYSWWMRE